MTIPLKYTGSDASFPEGVEIPILMIDGDQAASTYTEPSTGLPISRIEVPGCPNCNGAVGGTLLVNSLDGDHRYFRCPICGTFSRWEVQPNKTTARLDKNWRVYSGKTTDLDIDSEVPKWIE